MISFAGNITFPKAQSIRDAAQMVPLDRMLIETDSPYLAPIPHRGQRNEPAFVTEVARQIGDLRGLPAEEIGARTAQNFYKFFGLAPDNAGRALNASICLAYTSLRRAVSLRFAQDDNSVGLQTRSQRMPRLRR